MSPFVTRAREIEKTILLFSIAAFFPASPARVTGGDKQPQAYRADAGTTQETTIELGGMLMLGRLVTRLEKLEAQHGGMSHMREAVVRCAPIADSQAWAALLARLGWAGSQILVVLDATGADSEPEVVVPPIPHSDRTHAQQAALARAGNGAGRWWVGNAARPTMMPVEAFDGLAALTAQLKEQRINSQWGHTGGL